MRLSAPEKKVIDRAASAEDLKPSSWLRRVGLAMARRECVPLSPESQAMLTKGLAQARAGQLRELTAAEMGRRARKVKR